MTVRAFAYLVLLCTACCVSDGQPQITAVTNSADFKAGFPQKGSLASIFLTGLQGPSGVVVNTQNPLLNGFLDVEVWINFMPAQFWPSRLRTDISRSTFKYHGRVRARPS